MERLDLNCLNPASKLYRLFGFKETGEKDGKTKSPMTFAHMLAKVIGLLLQ